MDTYDKLFKTLIRLGYEKQGLIRIPAYIRKFEYEKIIKENDWFYIKSEDDWYKERYYINNQPFDYICVIDWKDGNEIPWYLALYDRKSEHVRHFDDSKTYYIYHITEEEFDLMFNDPAFTPVPTESCVNDLAIVQYLTSDKYDYSLATALDPNDHMDTVYIKIYDKEDEYFEVQGLQK